MTSRDYEEDESGFNAQHLDGAFTLTWVRPSGTALITVRGKDHNITAEEARELASDLLRVANRMSGPRVAKKRRSAARTVPCKFCERQVPANTAHAHQGAWVGDDCCWDERLVATQCSEDDV